VFWCSSLGDALTFAHSGSSSHCIEFLSTLETMCHLSLGVWTNILSVYLFVLFVVLFVFVCIYLFLFVYKVFYFLFVVMLLIGHNLHCNCGLHVIGVFNLFECCISLEILVFLFMCWIGETSLV
jgi:hypothetical protein